jgi:predicted small metal-binding protein
VFVVCAEVLLGCGFAALGGDDEDRRHVHLSEHVRNLLVLSGEGERDITNIDRS